VFTLTVSFQVEYLSGTVNFQVVVCSTAVSGTDGENTHQSKADAVILIM